MDIPEEVITALKYYASLSSSPLLKTAIEAGIVRPMNEHAIKALEAIERLTNERSTTRVD